MRWINPQMLPPLQGGVRFENLSFRFQKGQPQVLKDTNLDVPLELLLESWDRAVAVKAL